MKPLTIIPAYLTDAGDATLLERCLRSIRSTEEDATDILVVDDCSPGRDLVDEIERLEEELSFELHRKPENSGFAKTVNLGLRRCLDEGRDAVLLNADVELIDPGWLDGLRAQPRLGGQGEASVVGGLLLYPDGSIQHAGIYLSKLSSRPGRPWFDHMWRGAPGDLPEAGLVRVCPVTGALMFIRLECLRSVGLLDESFPMGSEDVDYCLRVLRKGRECIYQPKVRAYHEHGAFVDRRAPKGSPWANRSLERLWEKHGAEPLDRVVPSGDHLEGALAVEQVHKLRRALKANRKQVKTLTRENEKLERTREKLTARTRAAAPSSTTPGQLVRARARGLIESLLSKRRTR